MVRLSAWKICDIYLFQKSKETQKQKVNKKLKVTSPTIIAAKWLFWLALATANLWPD